MATRRGRGPWEEAAKVDVEPLSCATRVICLFSLLFLAFVSLQLNIFPSRSRTESHMPYMAGQGGRKLSMHGDEGDMGVDVDSTRILLQ